ncbi:MAG: GxxExxY protein [Verrucomicrobia bacterium]|nr:GxxExxY protein [Verrucomicrobiota bacterium]
MTENDLSKIIVDAAYRIHVDLGPGLLESVYEAVLAAELLNRGLKIERQKPIQFQYAGTTFDEGFRIDLLVNDLVIIELKSTEQTHPVHKKQLKTYLRLSNKKLGLLINFGTELFKDGVSRVVLGLSEP